MPQIIAGLLALFLYMALIYFLVKFVAPILMAGISLVLTATVSWLCAKTFWRTYSPVNPSPVGQMVILVVLLLLYCDFLTLIGLWVLPSSPAEATIFPLLMQLPTAWLTPLLAVPLGLQPLSLPAIGLAIALKGLFLPVILLSFRGLACEDRHATEPAFLSYFQKAAFRDLWNALKGCSQEIPRHIRPIADRIGTLAFGGSQVWVLWPLGITALLALIPPLVFASVFLGAILVFYGTSLFLLKIFNQYLALLLYWAEMLVMKIRAGYAKCPHSGCYEPLPLPIMICPGCLKEHHKLLPGNTGVFYRYCECGKSLPTLFLLGKDALPSRCTKCKQELPDQVFGANIHLPIYGGPDAGKTSFMAAGVAQLVNGRVADLQTGWLRDRDRINYEQKWQHVLNGGQGPAKTMEMLPNAYLISLQRQQGLAASLYLYDPAGEAIDSERKMGEFRYMTYCSGIILVVDPLSYPELAQRIEGEMPGAGQSRAAIRLTAREVFDRLVQQLEGLDVLRRSQHLNLPIAVIIAKSDLKPLCQELVGASVNTEVVRSAGEPESDQARGWLQQIDSALVHGIETRFRNVRYFAAAALPTNPNSSLPRESVLAPLCWLFSWQPVLAQPELTRWKWALLEWAAFAGVAVLAFTPPVGLLFYLLGWI